MNDTFSNRLNNGSGQKAGTCPSYGANASFLVGSINMSPLTGLFWGTMELRRAVTRYSEVQSVTPNEKCSILTNELFGSPANGRDPSPQYSSSPAVTPLIALPL